MEINKEMIDRLMKIDYFSNCSKKIAPDIRYGYEFVTLNNAIKSIKGVKWENIQLDVTGDLTVFLCKNHSEIYNKEYNRLVNEIKRSFINEWDLIYLERLKLLFGKDHKAILDDVHWNLLGIVIADVFKEIYRSEFYFDVLKVYESGQLPCGWRGKFPNGNMLIY